MSAVRNYLWWAARFLPGWMRGEWGSKFTDTFALATDALGDAATVALKAPWLLSKDSPADAVPLVGAECGMPRYPADSDESYRARVAGCWTSWQKAGKRPTPTTGGVVEELLAFGLTRVEMIRNYDWRTAGPPGTWANFSRFWIVIQQGGHSWLPTHVGGGTIGDGTVGSTATQHEVDSIRSIIRKRKAGHDVCPSIIVVFAGEIIGELGRVLGAGTIGATAIAWRGTV